MLVDFTEASRRGLAVPCGSSLPFSAWICPASGEPGAGLTTFLCRFTQTALRGVRSPFPLQARAFLPWPVLEPNSKGLRPGKAPDGELEASECDEGRESVSEVLVVLGQTAVSAEPRKGPL